MGEKEKKGRKKKRRQNDIFLRLTVGKVVANSRENWWGNNIRTIHCTLLKSLQAIYLSLTYLKRNIFIFFVFKLLYI